MPRVTVKKKLIVSCGLLILLIISFHLGKIEIGQRVGVFVPYSIAISCLRLGIIVHSAIALCHFISYLATFLFH